MEFFYKFLSLLTLKIRQNLIFETSIFINHGIKFL